MLILEFVIAFGLLVFLHELGHFLVTRLFGIEVEEFGFGYPPRLVKLFTWKGTDITLNWIPFGGFVRPKGENDPEIPDGLGAANPWKRLGVALAGPVMNLILGVVIFTIVFMKLGMPQSSVVKIVDVNIDSPAEMAGILPEDIILRVNETTIDSMTALSDSVKANLGEEIVIEYDRSWPAVRDQCHTASQPSAGRRFSGNRHGESHCQHERHPGCPLCLSSRLRARSPAGSSPWSA